MPPKKIPAKGVKGKLKAKSKAIEKAAKAEKVKPSRKYILSDSLAAKPERK